MTQIDLFEYYNSTIPELPRTREEYVTEFHKAFNHPIRLKEVPQDLVDLRLKLIDEERKELNEAINTYRTDQDNKLKREQVLKEMADLQYVLSGLAVVFGLDLENGFIRTHYSNMSKLGTDGKPIYREDGKVLKGPHYEPPYLGDLM